MRVLHWKTSIKPYDVIEAKFLRFKKKISYRIFVRFMWFKFDQNRFKIVEIKGLDRHIDRQTERHTDRETDKQTYN